ncbi:MAG: hypothetical protein ACRYFK_01620 [Janthinobacterium lividum]
MKLQPLVVGTSNVAELVALVLEVQEAGLRLQHGKARRRQGGISCFAIVNIEGNVVDAAIGAPLYLTQRGRGQLVKL